MKKFLLSLAAVIGFGCLTASADDVTITAKGLCGNPEGNLELTGDNATQTLGSYSFTFDVNGGSSKPSYYSNGENVRVYAKGKMVVKGAGMTKMVFNLNSAKRACEMVASTGTYTVTLSEDGKSGVGTWTSTEAVSEVTFTVPDTSIPTAAEPNKPAQFIWNQVVITGSGVVTPKAQDPVFSPVSGTVIPAEGLSVTITAGEGAKIYYTTDGTEPTTESDEYASPILLNKATTIKAMAAEEGKENSSIITAIYKDPAVTVANIKAFIDKADTENEVIIAGPVVVSGEFTYSSGISLYVQDETGSLLIFDKTKKLPEYSAGDRISNIAGTYSLYNDAAQMTPDVATFTAGVEGEAPEAKVVSVSEVTAAMGNQYVKLVNVGIETDAENSKNHYAVSGEDKILLYNRFSVTFPADATEGYDVFGYVASYNGTPQIYPATITETGKEPEKYEAATIAEFLEKAKDDATNVWTITGNVKTVYQNGNNLYVQDVDAPYTGLLVYGSLSHQYEAGTILTGIKGKWTNYYSTIEFTANAASFTEGVKGDAPVCTEMDLANVTADNQNLYVEFKQVTVKDYDETAKTFTMEDAKNDTFQGYNKWNQQVTVPTDAETTYNVKGFISYYQAKGEDAPKLQFYPIEFVDAAGVEGIAADLNAPAEYYTIDGLRVAQPENGIYIVRQGTKVYKVIVRK